MLAFSRVLEVFCGGADAAEVLKPQLCMFLFVISGCEEQTCDLLETVFLGVFVACLAFARKCSPKVLFGLGTLQIHGKNSLQSYFLNHTAFFLICQFKMCFSFPAASTMKNR